MFTNNTKQNLRVGYECVGNDPASLGQGDQRLGGIRPSLGGALIGEAGGAGSFRVPMTCLGGEQHAQQWWRIDGTLRHDVSSELDGVAVSTSQSDDFLFATVSVPDDLLEARSLEAYRALLKVLKAQHKPHLLRIWNFVPRINEFDGGTERYQLFNSGRRAAFRESGYTLSDGAPAACALGTLSGGLGVAVLAGTRPAVAIENPRQISSYHYPRQYGVDAPIFSRAAWLQQADGADVLFISGTASIVGHQTLHHGDSLAQLQESVRNIEAVLGSANQRAGSPQWTLSSLQGRVYIRHAADYALVSEYLQERGMTRFCYVHADICRSDLLVEIEAEGQAVHA